MELNARHEKELAIIKLQNALLRLPREDLAKLLKNTYQAMRIKHGIPYETRLLPANSESTSRTKTGKRRGMTRKRPSSRATKFGEPSLHSEPLAIPQRRVTQGTQYDESLHAPHTQSDSGPVCTRAESTKTMESLTDDYDYPTFRQQSSSIEPGESSSVHAGMDFVPEHEFEKLSLSQTRGPIRGYSYGPVYQMPHQFYATPGIPGRAFGPSVPGRFMGRGRNYQRC
ncbi:hypothetical protein BdWA1_001131 [Babesia duncani]|nr:hypothetical protein BdWA1_001131 [Babesia duncani]